MKRCTVMWFILITAIAAAAACKNTDTADGDIDPRRRIAEGFTFDNYPALDGSTSAEPLNILLACRLLGIDWEWEVGGGGEWRIEPVIKNVATSARFWKLIHTSQTHRSFLNLIEHQSDLILTARAASESELAYATDSHVELIETPVAIDAFIFIVNKDNPVSSLTVSQIQDIYTRKTTDWSEVGGPSMAIAPYMRNPDSGSQEFMQSVVMQDIILGDIPTAPEVIYSMVGAVDSVQYDRNAVSFTFYYYRAFILRGWDVKTIAVEGVHPDRESIADGSYPLAAPLYAVIRSDLDKGSTAYRLYELLQEEAGRQVIAESGYLPN